MDDFKPPNRFTLVNCDGSDKTISINVHGSQLAHSQVSQNVVQGPDAIRQFHQDRRPRRSVVVPPPRDRRGRRAIDAGNGGGGKPADGRRRRSPLDDGDWEWKGGTTRADAGAVADADADADADAAAGHRRGRPSRSRRRCSKDRWAKANRSDRDHVQCHLLIGVAEVCSSLPSYYYLSVALSIQPYLFRTGRVRVGVGHVLGWYYKK